MLCDFIAKRPGHMSLEAFAEHFRAKVSPDFDPERHLDYIGVANQTTMLAHESLAIGARIREAMREAHGEEYAASHFRSFGTICSATQDRQDAVAAMMEDPPQIMLVVGGYNSSNTNHLAHLCQSHTRTYHIQDATGIDVEDGTIRHKEALDPSAPETVDTDWLPEGPLEVGITAGASTPNNKIGETLLRLLQIRGIDISAESAAEGHAPA